MATTRKTPATPKARHTHQFVPFPSDPRYEHCKCGADRAVETAAANPAIKLWGRGPAGATCGGCGHLRQNTFMAVTVIKCDERRGLPLSKGGIDHSAATDQRPSWPACARYVDRRHSPQIAKGDPALLVSDGAEMDEKWSELERWDKEHE